MKKILAISVIALSSLSIVCAKSYDIVLSNPTKAGNVQLKPGQYKLKIDGSNATFTEVDSSKSFTTTVKVETNQKKFDGTKVQSKKDGDVDRLEEIDLGGSTTKLSF